MITFLSREEYSTAIFYHTETQRVAAEESKAALNASGHYTKPVVTPILPAMRFYVAEDHHQDYYKRNPLRYKFYRYLSGRDQYLDLADQDGEHQANSQ